MRNMKMCIIYGKKSNIIISISNRKCTVYCVKAKKKKYGVIKLIYYMLQVHTFDSFQTRRIFEYR